MRRSPPRPAAPGRRTLATPVVAFGPPPGSRCQVHRRVRRRLRRAQCPHHSDPGARTTGQRDRRALRRQRVANSSTASCHQPAACRGRPYTITTTSTTITGRTAPSASRSLRPLPAHDQRDPTVSDGGTGSTGCSTSISRSYDVSRVSGTINDTAGDHPLPPELLSSQVTHSTGFSNPTHNSVGDLSG